MADAPQTGFVKPALVTAAAAILLGWGLCFAAVLLAGGRDPRIPFQVWLVAHGSGLVAGDARVGLVPLGVTALFLVLLASVAHRVARGDISDLGPYAGIVGAGYGVVAAVLAAVTSTSDASVPIPRAAVGGLIVGAVGSGVGAGWRHRHDMTWLTAASDDVRTIVVGAGRAVGLILGVSLVLVLVQLGVHGRRAADLWGLLGPGVGGGIVLAGACLLSLPTLVLWTASVLVGPGFALGTGTSVDLTGSNLGAIPGFPTLAALPGPGEFPAWVLVLGLVLPTAGLWAGMVSTRVKVGLAAGAGAGLTLGILIGISGGGIGPGRMAEAGPPPVTPLVIAASVLAVTGALGSLLAHYRGRRVSTGPSALGRFGLGHRDEPSGPDRRDGKA